MKNKKLTAILTSALLIFGFTGCAENQIPELTDEQVQMVGEYVAVTLLKYDSNHQSRLVELPDMDLLMPEQPSSPAPDNSGQGPAEQNPGQDSTEPQPPAETQAPVEKSYTLEEVLELSEDMSIDFIGYRFCGSYPDYGEDNFLYVGATEGKKLLVLSFYLNNGGTQEQAVNILASGAVFQITVDGDYSRRALITGMDDDMAVFSETIPANERVEAVLLIEVDDNMGDVLSSIELNVKKDSETYKIRLL